jgi:hypothetical protein
MYSIIVGHVICASPIKDRLRNAVVKFECSTINVQRTQRRRRGDAMARSGLSTCATPRNMSPEVMLAAVLVLALLAGTLGAGGAESVNLRQRLPGGSGSGEGGAGEEGSARGGGGTRVLSSPPGTASQPVAGWDVRAVGPGRHRPSRHRPPDTDSEPSC